MQSWDQISNQMPFIELFRNSLQQDRWRDCLFGLDNTWSLSEVMKLFKLLDHMVYLLQDTVCACGWTLRIALNGINLTLSGSS